ncbi:MAG TPA: MauE/DoxX family redox-associated membrane protein, partial [Cyclobacteriaceae bacterium]|nr:MauE/DoxX family redox-associated membrane protein [Cyclobacteriaceae bacterium]
MKRVLEIISSLLIMLFVYAAVSKVIDMEQFRIQLRQSPLITKFSSPISIAIPMIEILASVLLAIPSYRLVGLYCSLALMSLFTFYIIAILNL